jgi:hypothetical protein
VGEARRCQYLLRGGEVIAGDDQIQVLVGAGLAAEQRVDTPAAVQPDHQAGSFELAEDPAGIGGVDLHHRSSQPRHRHADKPPAASAAKSSKSVTRRGGTRVKGAACQRSAPLCPCW